MTLQRLALILLQSTEVEAAGKHPVGELPVMITINVYSFLTPYPPVGIWI